MDVWICRDNVYGVGQGNTVLFGLKPCLGVEGCWDVQYGFIQFIENCWDLKPGEGPYKLVIDKGESK